MPHTSQEENMYSVLSVYVKVISIEGILVEISITLALIISQIEGG
jgi:hypothetical protein